MKAYVITLEDNQYSEQCTDRCIQSARNFGVEVEKFYGVDEIHAQQIMKFHNLKWTWADNNTQNTICPLSGMKQFPYKNKRGKLAKLKRKIGCSMSHFLLWTRCVETDTPMLILEHDAVFIRPLPEIEFKGICQINDPTGATPKGKWWADQMKARGEGVFRKTIIQKDFTIPDGLAGNSAYLIKPWAAAELIDAFNEYGVWPNDATMNRQFFPYLEEYYPFVTVVKQSQSTTI